jgi:hypothetical protein
MFALDFNNDGNDDFVIRSNGAPNYIASFRSNGNGSFTEVPSGIPNTAYWGNSARMVSLDFNYNNDDWDDFIIRSNHGPNYPFASFRSNGNGTFTEVNSGIIDTAFWETLPKIVNMDFNGDNQTDFLVRTNECRGIE